jgi:hypothetical protein
VGSLFYIRGKFLGLSHFTPTRLILSYNLAMSSLSLILNTLLPASGDPDANAYIAATGATDVANIEAFVVGVKELVAWSNTAGWLLRSGQNFDTGSVVKVLGGIPDMDADLVGTTIRGVNGIVFDAVTVELYCDGLTTAVEEYSLLLISTMPTSGTAGSVTRKRSAASAIPMYWLNPRTGFGAEYRFNGSNAVTSENALTGFNLYGTLASVGAATQGVQNTAVVATAGVSAPAIDPGETALGIDQPIIINQYEGTASALFLFRERLVDVTPFYNLYKATLGQGLGMA